MAIVYDFKNIKKACNDISESILGPDKGEKYVVFEPETDLSPVDPAYAPQPRFPPANKGAVPAPPKAGIAKYCELCRHRLVFKPGSGWYCPDCDAFR